MCLNPEFMKQIRHMCTRFQFSIYIPTTLKLFAYDPNTNSVHVINSRNLFSNIYDLLLRFS